MRRKSKRHYRPRKLGIRKRNSQYRSLARRNARMSAMKRRKKRGDNYSQESETSPMGCLLQILITIIVFYIFSKIGLL